MGRKNENRERQRLLKNISYYQTYKLISGQTYTELDLSEALCTKLETEFGSETFTI